MKQMTIDIESPQHSGASIERITAIKEDVVEEARRKSTEHTPDTGYAWVILAVMFVQSSIIGGANRIYGLIYAKQVAIGYYNRQEANWPNAAGTAVENLAALVTPVLATYLTWRQIQFLSMSLFVIANVMAYFSDSLLVDIISMGVIQGLAASIAILILLALNNLYFRRYRSTAFGISLSGSTCGVFYMGPIVSHILDEYTGFRTVYLVLAGFSALGLILGAFIKTPKLAEEAPEVSVTQEEGLRQETVSRARLSIYDTEPMALERKRSVASVSMEFRLKQSPKFGLQRASIAGSQDDSVHSLSKGHPNKMKKTDLEFGVKGMESSVESGRGAAEAPEKKTSSFEAFRELLVSPYLHCTWIMLSIYYLVARVFILILVDMAEDRGLDRESAQALLNFWSLGEILGRIFMGPLIDLRWLSVRACIVYTCCSLALILVAIIPAGDSFALQATYSACVAALISLEYMLINVLMVEYLGEESATNCYACASLLAAPTLLVRPVLIGIFRDQLGSYDGLVILLAAIALGYGLFFGLFEPCLARRWPKKSSNQQK